MTAPPAEPAAPTGPPPGGPRGLLGGHGLTALAWAAATAAVELGVYALAVFSGGPGAYAALAALAAAVLWVVSAAPVAGATADDALGALLRAGAVIDGSLVLLVVLWAAGPAVDLPAVGKIYCILLAAGLAPLAVCRLGRSVAGRLSLAVIAAGGMIALAGSPFWVGGALHAASGPAAARLAAAAVYVNPFYGIAAAVAETTGFVWHEATVMYHITRIGDYAPAPPGCWYAPVAIHGLAAALVGSVAVLLRRR